MNIEPGTGRVWISNLGAGTVTVVGGRSDTPIATIHTGKGAAEVAFDRGRAYVANSFAGTVTVVSTRTLKVLRTIHTGLEYTQSVAIDQKARKLYVASYRTAVLVYNLRTGALVKRINGDDVNFVAADQATHRIYVSNYNDATLSVINTASDKITRTIPVGHPAEPTGCYEEEKCVVNPSGPDGIAIDERTNRLYVDNVIDGNIAVVSGRSGKVVKTIRTRPGEFWPTLDEAANRVYSGNYAEATVTVLDGRKGGSLGTFKAGKPFAPRGCFSHQASCKSYGSGVGAIAYDPVNGRLYVPQLAEHKVQVFVVNKTPRSVR